MSAQPSTRLTPCSAVRLCRPSHRCSLGHRQQRDRAVANKPVLGFVGGDPKRAPADVLDVPASATRATRRDWPRLLRPDPVGEACETVRQAPCWAEGDGPLNTVSHCAASGEKATNFLTGRRGEGGDAVILLRQPRLPLPGQHPVGLRQAVDSVQRPFSCHRTAPSSHMPLSSRKRYVDQISDRRRTRYSSDSSGDVTRRRRGREFLQPPHQSHG